MQISTYTLHIFTTIVLASLVQHIEIWISVVIDNIMEGQRESNYFLYVGRASLCCCREEGGKLREVPFLTGSTSSNKPRKPFQYKIFQPLLEDSNEVDVQKVQWSEFNFLNLVGRFSYGQDEIKMIWVRINRLEILPYLLKALLCHNLHWQLSTWQSFWLNNCKTITVYIDWYVISNNISISPLS